MTDPHNTELRVQIREIIKALLPQIEVLTRRHTVTITDDNQLNSFVKQVAAMLDDPITGPTLRSGELRFHLDTPPSQPSAAAPTPDHNTPGGTIVIERGVLTERIVARAITEHAQIVLGPNVVITPLAREHIRKSAVTIVKRP